jgi:hypothetical protein
MTLPNDRPAVVDGDPVTAVDMVAALTNAPLVFPDGATQVFRADGSTVYTERNRPTEGTWSVLEDGKFSSFWPPTYRATYILQWIVVDGASVGLRFIDTNSGQRFDGRYQ